jgi:hypothetical protein
MEIDVPLIRLSEGHAALAGFEPVRAGIDVGRSLEIQIKDAREPLVLPQFLGRETSALCQRPEFGPD